jgi:hypothetical protein
MAETSRFNLVVTLYPGGVIGLRQARCRKEYTLPLLVVFREAIDAETERTRAEKRKASGKKFLAKRGLLGRA